MIGDELNHLERQIGYVLSAGVALSASLLAVGLVLWAADLTAAGPVLTAGILVLMAIPVIRIVASFADAVRRRDRLLGWATATVLLIMFTMVMFSWLKASRPPQTLNRPLATDHRA